MSLCWTVLLGGAYNGFINQKYNERGEQMRYSFKFYVFETFNFKNLHATAISAAVSIYLFQLVDCRSQPTWNEMR